MDFSSPIIKQVRYLVSRDKRRFVDMAHDLDLTYITDRLIAMCFPSQGFVQKTYRNSIDEFAKFLQEHHQDKYFVINVWEFVEYFEFPFSEFANFEANDIWRKHFENFPEEVLLDSVLQLTENPYPAEKFEGRVSECEIPSDVIEIQSDLLVV